MGINFSEGNRATLLTPENTPDLKETAPSYLLGGQPVEHQIAREIGWSLTSLFRATGRRPDIWNAALKRMAPHRPTQARRAFREFMSWGDDQRDQTMFALESAIDWATEDQGKRLQDVISECQLSPALAHALFSCWPASERDAISEPYNRWRKAVNKLVTRYQRLAFKLASQQHQRTGGDGDWVSHAFFALIRAAEMYDNPTKAEFMTFAYRWIKFELKKASEREYENNRLTSFTLDTHSEAKHILNGDEKDLVGLLANPDQQFVALNRAKEICSAINLLTAREQFVIRRLYGLNEEELTSTAQQVSLDIGVTRARVYQIKATAFSKLRQRLAL
ncbi:sigma-70 family RNA polymerase sigma factor [Marinobacter sp.]|uniref:sigma-70 family RNA polymerase sigma factor n=1 Tax=Marinobacter sp. TaxID=50741 RepID=UPI003A8EDFD7